MADSDDFGIRTSGDILDGANPFAIGAWSIPESRYGE